MLDFSRFSRVLRLDFLGQASSHGVRRNTMTNPKQRVQLADLAHADKVNLVDIWTRLNGQPPSFRASRELLILALAWEIQARKFGGLKPTVRRRMDRLAKAYLRGGSIDLDRPLRYRPGTVLLRQWKGKRHSVTILEEGYGYNGKTYGSLSQIAREITGSRWNGPAFFGFRKGAGRHAEVTANGE
jgi:hypothetical protein